MSKALVVCYSRTSHTRQLAEAIASVGGWELEAIEDLRSHTGFRGYLRSGYEATFHRPTPIAPPKHDPAAYDLVVIGTPIWNGSVSSPVRAWMAQESGRLRSVAFFSTCGGHGAQRVHAQMAELAGHEPLATLDLTESELERGELPARVGRFVASLEEVLRRHAQPPQPSG